MATPSPVARTRTASRDTQAFATSRSELFASKTSESSSGSAKCGRGVNRVTPDSLMRRGRSVPTVTGARFGTVTANVWVAARAAASAAVIVTVAPPLAIAVNFRVPPSRETRVTVESEEEAANVRESPSGSLKKGESTSAVESPDSTVCVSIEPTGNGGRLRTVTASDCVAVRPSTSVAVTVTVAPPLARAAMDMALPDTPTSIVAESEAAAVNDRRSPSGSLKKGARSIRVVSPGSASQGGIFPDKCGTRFGTVTSNTCVVARPSVSATVIVTATSPFPTAAIVRADPVTETSATEVSGTDASLDRGSPSGSLNTSDRSTTTESPAAMVRTASPAPTPAFGSVRSR